jgi:HK97 gp10 family phage protein
MAELEMQGWAEIKERLLGMPDKMVNNVLRGAMRDGANLVKGYAQGLCPVETGALKASIRVVARRGTPTRVVFNVVAGGDFSAAKASKYGIGAAYYAVFVERGTVHAPSHPFMQPALEEGAQSVLDTVIQSIGDRLPETVA